MNRKLRFLSTYILAAYLAIGLQFFDTTNVTITSSVLLYTHMPTLVMNSRQKLVHI